MATAQDGSHRANPAMPGNTPAHRPAGDPSSGDLAPNAALRADRRPEASRLFSESTATRQLDRKIASSGSTTVVRSRLSPCTAQISTDRRTGPFSLGMIDWHCIATPSSGNRSTPWSRCPWSSHDDPAMRRPGETVAPDWRFVSVEMAGRSRAISSRHPFVWKSQEKSCGNAGSAAQPVPCRLRAHPNDSQPRARKMRKASLYAAPWSHSAGLLERIAVPVLGQQAAAAKSPRNPFQGPAFQ